jgi:hypothetical protein
MNKTVFGISAIKLLKICCFCIFYYNCSDSSKVQNVDARYVVDIDVVEEKEDVFLLSDIIKKVRPILLEETDYALIGDIDEMQVFDGNIFVLDILIAKKLFVYDMNGKYIRQIGTVGQGPDEYMGIASFCIDSARKEIYLLDYWKNRLLKYRIEDGKLLDKIDLPQNISYSDIAYVENNIYASITHDEPDKNNNLLFKIDLETGKFEEYLNAKIFSTGLNQNIRGGIIKSNYPKYSGEYTNTVFLCNKDGVYPYMTVKSKDWVRNGDIPATEDDDNIIYESIRKKERAYNIRHYFENDTCIHFEYRHRKNTYHIVYNKQTQVTYRYQSTLNDIVSRTDYNPVYNLFSINSKFAYDRMYSAVVLLFLSEEKFSVELTKQLELLTLDEEGFVIMEYELK